MATPQRGLLTNLYGFDPEERRRERLAGYDRLLAAQQTPQSRMGFAIGSLFGEYLAPESPEQGKISVINRAVTQAAQQFPDQTSPEFYAAVAELIPDTYMDSKQFALAEARKAQAALEESVNKRMKTALDFPESITPRLMQLAQRIQANPNDVAALNEYNQLAQAGQRGALKIAAETEEKPIAPGQEIARAAGDLGIPIPRDVRQFSQEQWKLIDAKIRKTEIERAAASAAKLNFTDPKSQVAAITEINNQLKPLTQQIQALDQSIALRRNDKSPFSQKLFEQTVAGAFGDSQKAAAEISRLVNTGNLGQRVTNTLGLFLSGQIGTATKEDQLESLNAIRDYVSKQYDDTASVYRPVLGEQADKVAPLAGQRFQRPKLPPNQQYIPIDVVNKYGLTKGKRGKKGDIEFVYNGDGTITILKGQ